MSWEIWGDGDDDPELLRYQRQRQREAQRRHLWLQRQAEIEEERRRQQLQRRRQIWLLLQREAAEERRREEEELRQEREALVADISALVADILARYRPASPPTAKPAPEVAVASDKAEILEEIADVEPTKEVVAQKTALHDDFVLQIPVDSDLGIASSQIPCVDNFEIFPTVGYTLPESPWKASESDLQLASNSAQDVLNVSKDVNEVFFTISEPKEEIFVVIVDKSRCSRRRLFLRLLNLEFCWPCLHMFLHLLRSWLLLPLCFPMTRFEDESKISGGE